jgi:hypothetical protein
MHRYWDLREAFVVRYLDQKMKKAKTLYIHPEYAGPPRYVVIDKELWEELSEEISDDYWDSATEPHSHIEYPFK